MVAGCEINDNPFAPLCRACKDKIAAEGDATPIAWMPRDHRFVEKLATPDVTIADIIGDVDPIRAARGGRDLSDELTIHYGLLPRANRGIFAINELPDLAGKIQVGLFNIMQEGDIQIKGYPLRLPLDVLIVFTANPEDYTARGKIITPLKDRIGAEIRTHYPSTVAEGMTVTNQEAWVGRDPARKIDVPEYLREVIEEIAFQAREDKRVDKRSGVSQRLPITTLESAVSSAEQRAARTGEKCGIARIADIYAAMPAITGKLELEYEGELKGADTIARELIRSAVGRVFSKRFGEVSFQPVIQWFELGGELKLPEAGEHRRALRTTLENPRADGTCRQARRQRSQRRRLCISSSRNDSRRPLGASPHRPQRRARLLRGKAAATGAARESESPAPAIQLAVSNRKQRVRGNSSSGALGPTMKFIKYGKYVGEPADAIDLEELVKKLGNFFLQSGFESQFYGVSEMDPEKSMEALKDAILRALQEGDLMPEGAMSDELREMLQNPNARQNQEVKDLIEKLMERMAQEGYINPQQPPQVTPPPQSSARGQVGEAQERDTEARFEITDKTIDFLGFKTLQDLLGSLGRSSFGRHATRDLATGIETSGASRQYEFGDTMNLDISETLFNAVRRDGAKVPVEITYKDLMVHQCEYYSSCATVVLLDCSHSMILYGEDRFTPAKRVAMALSHLIRTQYPGDTLNLVLFHDSAEEVPIGELARVQVGPYYTNTREGLRMAQRILLRQKKDMRQIIMITDGKPSALTLEDGRIYKNAFGLDPFVVGQTLEEVNKCKRAGILINTFMLASDYSLINFVQKITEMCRGKAYFTTPYTLGQYLLMDYMQRKTKQIH